MQVLIFLLTFDLVIGQVCKTDLRFCPAEAKDSATANQLPDFKESQKGPIRPLTSNVGRKLDKLTANNALNKPLIRSLRLFDALTGLSRETTLPRIVHAKAAGAMGIFEVTHDVSDIMDIDVFSKIGKKTNVTVRLSTTAGEIGTADTVRDNRGFAVKFFTQEGVLDILSLTTRIFVLKDAIKFPTFTHATKRNPQTNKLDPTMLWDFITLNIESVAFFLRIFGDLGIPCSLEKLPGFAIHTFSFCNSKNQTHFGRFRWVPDAGEEGLPSGDAKRIAGENPEYHTQELFDMIASGKYPSWTLMVQPLTLKQVQESKLNVFDTTIDLEDKKYPTRPIGKLILNQNPVNFNRDIEPLTFCVRNLVPGLNACDQVFDARFFMYLDAQNHRRGVNHDKIPPNRPKIEVNTYQRDGVEPLGDNGNNEPNYYPNSFGGPVPVAEPKCPYMECPPMSRYTDPNPTNLGQASEYFDSLSKEEQKRLVGNIADSLSQTPQFLQERAVKVLTGINKNLGTQVAAGLVLKSKPCPEVPKLTKDQKQLILQTCKNLPVELRKFFRT